MAIFLLPGTSFNTAVPVSTVNLSIDYIRLKNTTEDATSNKYPSGSVSIPTYQYSYDKEDGWESQLSTAYFSNRSAISQSNRVFAMRSSGGINVFGLDGVQLYANSDASMIFSGMSLMKVCDLLSQINWSRATNLANTFSLCRNLKFRPDTIVTDNVTNMHGAFRSCYNATGTIKLSSRATDISFAYSNCNNTSGSLPTIPTSVTNAAYAFTNCNNVTGSPRITENISNAAGMYCGCKSISGSPVITNNVVDMEKMYYASNVSGTAVVSQNIHCNSLKLTYMFCSRITTQAPANQIQHIENMDNTYSGCVNLTGEPYIGPNVIYANDTFNNCYKLTGYPSCPPSVIFFEGTYNNCQNLTGMPVLGPNVSGSLMATYADCRKLTGAPLCNPNITDMTGTYENCYNLSGPPISGVNVISMFSTYSNCFNMAGTPNVGANVVNLAYAYDNCYNITGTPVSPAKVNNMYYAYANCYNLTGASAVGAACINLCSAYYDCQKLTGTCLSPANVEDMDYAYYNCGNTTGCQCGAKVTTMRYAYWNCQKIAAVGVCGTNVINMEYAYWNCLKIDNAQSGANVINMSHAFEYCNQLGRTYKSGNTTIKCTIQCGVNVEDMSWAYAHTLQMACGAVCGANVTNMQGAYYNSAVTSAVVGANVVDMSNAYAEAHRIAQFPCGASVVNMSHAYYNSKTDLNAAPTVSSMVQDMSYAFWNCRGMAQVAAVNTSVNNMAHAYEDCFKLTKVAIPVTNTASVINMAFAYANCNVATQMVNETKVLITENNLSNIKVSDFSSVFYNCVKLTGYALIPHVKNSTRNVSGAYYNCQLLSDYNGETKLTKLQDRSSNWTYSNNTFYNCTNLKGDAEFYYYTYNAEYMYYNCFNLAGTIIPPSGSGFYLNNIAYMLYNCSNLTGSVFSTSYCQNMAFAFYNCVNLTGGLAWSTSYCTNMAFAFTNVVNLTGSRSIGIAVTNAAYAYSNCHNITGTAYIPASVVNCEGLYQNCYRIYSSPQIPAKAEENIAYTYQNTNVSGTPVYGNASIVNMAYTYANCTKLTGAPNFPSYPIENISHTYENCYNLTGSFITSLKKTGMTTIQCANSVFANCVKLTGTFQNLSELDIEDASFMIAGCTNITGVLSDDCYPQNCRNIDGLFKDTNLYGKIHVPDYIVANITSIAWLFANTHVYGDPIYPSTCTNIAGAFLGLYEIKTFGTVPSKVTDMAWCFANTYMVTGTTAAYTLQSPASVTNMQGTYYNTIIQNIANYQNAIWDAKEKYMFTPVVGAAVKDMSYCYAFPEEMYLKYLLLKYSGSGQEYVFEDQDDGHFYIYTNIQFQTFCPKSFVCPASVINMAHAYEYRVVKPNIGYVVGAGVQDMSYAYHCVTGGITPVSPANVINMSHAYDSATIAANIAAPTKTYPCGANVKDMSWAYNNCVLRGGTYQCGAKVTNMQGAFANPICRPFAYDKIPNSDDYDIQCYGHYPTGAYVCGANVEDMSWAYANHLTNGAFFEIPNSTSLGANDFIKYNTLTPVVGANVINMAHAYENSMTIKSFACGDKVKDMSFAYADCIGVNTAPVVGPNVVNMRGAYYCRSPYITISTPYTFVWASDFRNQFNNEYKKYFQAFSLVSGNFVCPDKVEDMSLAYAGCYNMYGAPKIGPNVRNAACAYLLLKGYEKRYNTSNNVLNQNTWTIGSTTRLKLIEPSTANYTGNVIIPQSCEDVSYLFGGLPLSNGKLNIYVQNANLNLATMIDGIVINGSTSNTTSGINIYIKNTSCTAYTSLISYYGSAAFGTAKKLNIITPYSYTETTLPAREPLERRIDLVCGRDFSFQLKQIAQGYEIKSIVFSNSYIRNNVFYCHNYASSSWINEYEHRNIDNAHLLYGNYYSSNSTIIFFGQNTKTIYANEDCSYMFYNKYYTYYDYSFMPLSNYCGIRSNFTLFPSGIDYKYTKNMAYFASYSNTIITPICGPNVTNMDYAYYYCYNLTTAVCGDNVKTMTSTYYYCNHLTTAVCGPNVIDMTSTYTHSSVRTPVCGPNVRFMDKTYYYTPVTSIACGPNVVSMTQTYYGCNSLQRFTLNNAPKLKALYFTFAYCINLLEANIYADVKYYNNTFSNCNNLHTVRITSNVPIIFDSKTFYNCTNLKNVYLNADICAIRSSGYYYDNATLFENCNVYFNGNFINDTHLAFFIKNSKQEIFLNIQTQKYLNYAYPNCSNLKTSTPGTVYFGSGVFSSSHAFENCINLAGEINGSFATYANYMSNEFGEINTSYMFYNCYKLTGTPVIPPITVHCDGYIYYWNDGYIYKSSGYLGYTNIAYMYYNCTNLSGKVNKICAEKAASPFTSFNSNFSYAFYNCQNITSAEMNWCWGKCNYEFYNCRNLTSATGWQDVGEYKYAQCVNLTGTIHLASGGPQEPWGVLNSIGMFENCHKQLNLYFYSGSWYRGLVGILYNRYENWTAETPTRVNIYIKAYSNICGWGADGTVNITDFIDYSGKYIRCNNTSDTANTTTWTSMTNGRYNALYNIYVYTNYTSPAWTNCTHDRSLNVTLSNSACWINDSYQYANCMGCGF